MLLVLYLTCCCIAQVKYIGYFETEEGAARAYDKAVVQTRGSTAQVRELHTMSCVLQTLEGPCLLLHAWLK